MELTDAASHSNPAPSHRRGKAQGSVLLTPSHATARSGGGGTMNSPTHAARSGGGAGMPQSPSMLVRHGSPGPGGAGSPGPGLGSSQQLPNPFAGGPGAGNTTSPNAQQQRDLGGTSKGTGAAAGIQVREGGDSRLWATVWVVLRVKTWKHGPGLRGWRSVKSCGWSVGGSLPVLALGLFGIGTEGTVPTHSTVSLLLKHTPVVFPSAVCCSQPARRTTG